MRALPAVSDEYFGETAVGNFTPLGAFAVGVSGSLV